MFCDNCGKPLEEGSAFCVNCGSPVQQQTTENSDSILPEPNFDGNEVGFVTPPVKESFIQKALKFIMAKKAILISAIVLILVIAFSVSFYPYAKNAFMKVVKSPEGYFEYVVENNTEGISETIATTINTIKESFVDELGGEAKISFKLEDTFYDVIEDITGEDVSEYIGWLKSASINNKFSVEDDMISANYEAKLNGTNLGSYEFVGDVANSEFYFGIPDYNPSYVYMNMGEMFNSDDFEEAIEQIELIAQSLPDESKLENMFSRYLTCIVKSVENVKETSDTLTVDGISQSATKLSVNITGDLVVNAAKGVVKEALDDKELQKILAATEELTKISYDDFQKGLEELLSELDNVDLDDVDEAELALDLYVNNKGEIIGIIVEFAGGEFKYAVPEKGGHFGFEISFTPNGTGSVSLEGSGDVSGSKYSGEFNLSVMGFKALEFKMVNFDDDAFEKGAVKGRFEIEAPSIPALDDFKLIIDSKSDSADKINFDLILECDEETISSINCTVETSDASKISLPKNYIEMKDPNDLQDWIDSFDISGFCNNLRKAGVPDEFVNGIEDNIG